MSEFLAEARVLVRPDTTKFRAELVAQLAVATKGVAVPVQVIPATTSTAGLTALTTASQVAARAQAEVAGATNEKAKADKTAEKAAASHARQLTSVRTAALASAASMTGLRGAVLTAGGAFLGATVAIQAFGKAVQSAAALETELNVFRVTAGATADEMERVREVSVALGRDIRLPAVSAGDAAQAITLLARAGLSVEDSLAGARGVLQLATAAQIDNATATQLAASALNAFGLAGEDAVRVADLLANSANLSQGEITDMGIALRQSAGAAAQVGLSLEDTVTVLTALARTGLAGSDAGTTLRVALLRLVAPTKDAQKALEQFNVQLRDSAGNVRVEAFLELEDALRNVSKAEADRARVAIFGQNAFRISALLGRESARSFAELEASVTRQGAAAELAGARTQGFAGQMEALRSNLETLGTTLGGALLPALSLFVGSLNDLVTTGAQATDAARSLAGGVLSARDAFIESVPGLERYSDLLNSLAKDLIGPAAGFTFTAKQIQRFSGVFRDSADTIETDATEIEGSVRSLFSTFSEAGGLGSPTAVNEFVNALDELADTLAKGDPAAQKLSGRIRGLIKELQNPATFKVDLDFDFNESDLKAAGQRAGDDTVEGALLSLRAAGSKVAAVGLDWISDLSRATVPAATKAGSDTGDAFVKGFNDAQVRGQLQAQKTAVAQAQAFGDTGLEELIAERDRIDRILNSARAPTGPALESLLQERISVVNEIERILQQEADAKEEAAGRIQTAQDEADQKFLDALGGREGRLENAAIIAGASASLKDDLATQVALRNFYKNSITEIRKTVKDAQERARAIAEATRNLIRAKNEVADAKRELKEALQQERRDERERLRESLSLDVQIAQATGNLGREQQARQTEIDFIKQQIRQTRAGSNQRKRLILELRQKQKELRELSEVDKEANRSAQEFFFEQLQAQQGFASNLLGNLIPRDQTAGLVGVPSPTPASLQAQVSASANAAAGKAGGGPTAGQASTTNDILLRILEQLRALNDDREHPEATRQRRKQMAVMDFEHGQGGVM